MTSIPDAVEALSAQLRDDLAGVGDRIEAEVTALITGWPRLGRDARVRRLRQLSIRVSALATSAASIARAGVGGVIDQAYRFGAQRTALAVSRTAVLGGSDLDAIAVMAGDTYADLLVATQHIQETTKALVRYLAKERVADALVRGEGTAPAARGLARDLQGRGIAAITYKDGAQHGLRDYSDMVLRTKTAEAHQVGGFAQAAEVGIEYVELMDGPGCGLSSHKDPRKANGLILKLDEAARYPLSHPRCRRVSSPRPDLDAESLANATPIGPQFTAEDIAREHASGGTGTSKAQARYQATVAARAQNGTIATARPVPVAVRSHQAKVKKRTGPA